MAMRFLQNVSFIDICLKTVVFLELAFEIMELKHLRLVRRCYIKQEGPTGQALYDAAGASKPIRLTSIRCYEELNA
jgi:hypothetical protein